MLKDCSFSDHSLKVKFLDSTSTWFPAKLEIGFVSCQIKWNARLHWWFFFCFVHSRIYGCSHCRLKVSDFQFIFLSIFHESEILFCLWSESCSQVQFTFFLWKKLLKLLDTPLDQYGGPLKSIGTIILWCSRGFRVTIIGPSWAREPGSKHYSGLLIEGPLKPLGQSQHYGIDGLKEGPQLGPYYA